MILVQDLLGIPFVLGGRTLAGVDCWGICAMLCRRLGIDLQDPWPAICEAWHENWNDSEAFVPAGWVSLAPATPPEPLDILVIDRANGVANHVAICVGDGYVLHAAIGATTHLVQFRALKRRLRAIWRRAA